MTKPFIPAGTMLIMKHYDLVFVALEDSTETIDELMRPGEVCYRVPMLHQAGRRIVYTDTRKWFLDKFKIFWPEDLAE